MSKFGLPSGRELIAGRFRQLLPWFWSQVFFHRWISLSLIQWLFKIFPWPTNRFPTVLRTRARSRDFGPDKGLSQDSAINFTRGCPLDFSMWNSWIAFLSQSGGRNFRMKCLCRIHSPANTCSVVPRLIRRSSWMGSLNTRRILMHISHVGSYTTVSMGTCILMSRSRRPESYWKIFR